MTAILATLHPPKGAVKDELRLGRGRGSGKGKTSGKGMKGQRARSGGRGKPNFEGGQMPLQRRLPKRGFRNPFRKDVAVVNLRDLARFAAGSTVTLETLAEAGLVKKLAGRDAVKVLGVGDLDRALTVHAHAFSGTAKEKIEKAGGKAVVIGAEETPSATAQGAST
ncbi:MAG: 50S ribosomal protein L15 [Deltaproteobacteria bacterium]|nr:50S ribosomal protein L15 [Deltaproteobacteria bacterium]